MAAFDRELALEARGHLYTREAAANTWYAKGACYLDMGDRKSAAAAFREALTRVPQHPLAHAGLAIAEDQPLPTGFHADTTEAVDSAIARASRLVRAGHVQRAVHIVSAALTSAPQDNGGWLLPIEPLLRVGRDHQEWAPALAALNLRAR